MLPPARLAGVRWNGRARVAERAGDLSGARAAAAKPYWAIFMVRGFEAAVSDREHRRSARGKMREQRGCWIDAACGLLPASHLR